MGSTIIIYMKYNLPLFIDGVDGVEKRGDDAIVFRCFRSFRLECPRNSVWFYLKWKNYVFIEHWSTANLLSKRLKCD